MRLSQILDSYNHFIRLCINKGKFLICNSSWLILVTLEEVRCQRILITYTPADTCTQHLKQEAVLLATMSGNRAPSSLWRFYRFIFELLLKQSKMCDMIQNLSLTQWFLDYCVWVTDEADVFSPAVKTGSSTSQTRRASKFNLCFLGSNEERSLQNAKVKGAQSNKHYFTLRWCDIHMISILVYNQRKKWMKGISESFC